MSSFVRLAHFVWPPVWGWWDVEMLRLVPRRLHKAFQKFDVKRGSLSDTSTLGNLKCLNVSCITSCFHSACCSNQNISLWKAVDKINGVIANGSHGVFLAAPWPDRGWLAPSSSQEGARVVAGSKTSDLEICFWGTACRCARIHVPYAESDGLSLAMT